MTVDVLKGLLLTAPKGTIKQIADVVLTKCVEENHDRSVDINDYQGDIDNYVLLVCHGLIGEPD